MIIRAVVAAFLFLGLVILMAGSRSRPLTRMLDYGDFWLEARRPLKVEGLLFSSDGIKNWRESPEGQKRFRAWNDEHNRLKKLLGNAFELIGWGPWRVTIVISSDQPPLIAVGAGIMAPLGPGLMRSPGFEPADPVEGFDALQKEDHVFVTVKNYWIIGTREAAAKAIKAITAGNVPPWWKLPWKLAGGSDSVIIVSPRALREIVYPGDSTLAARTAMKEWMDVEDWSGALATINLHRNRISGRAWFVFEDDKPFARLWAMLGKGPSTVGWLHPQTTFAARLNIKDPAAIWKEAKAVYSNRPLPYETIGRIEEELRRELNIEIDNLLDHIHQNVGLLKIPYEGKEHSVLFTGAGRGVDKAMLEMETGITGTWQSTFAVIPIRYMPRLLAYGVIDEKLFVASDPQVMGAYAEGMTKASKVPALVKKMGNDLSSSPLLLAGRLYYGEEGQAQNNSSGWYIAGVDYSDNRFEARAVAPVRYIEKPKMPFRARLLGWGATLAEVLAWVLAALALGIFFSSALSLNPNRSAVKSN